MNVHMLLQWDIVLMLVKSLQSIETLTYLLPEMCNCDLSIIIYKLMSRIDIFSIFYEVDPRWPTQDLTDD